MKRFSLFIIIALFSFSCSSGYIKLNVVNSMPNNFQNVMKGGKNIGIVVIKSKYERFDVSWERMLQGDMENSFRNFGYFNIIDIASRKTRLQEISISQTGLTKEAKEIGQELALDGLLYLEVTNPPRSSYKTTYETKTETYKCPEDKKSKKKKKKRKTCTRKVKITVKTLNLTVFIRGKLVNIETGQSLAYTNTKPVSISNRGRGRSVSYPQFIDVFQRASQIASVRLASRLSPQMSVIKAELGDDPVGAPKSSHDRVEKLLEKGNEWARTGTGNMDKAIEYWQQALTKSNNKSAYAWWNLALAAWSDGKLNAAKQNFDMAFKHGRSDFSSSSKMKLFSKFKEEKKRAEMER